MQQETYRGGPMRGVNGLYLMQRISGAMVHEPQQMRGCPPAALPRPGGGPALFLDPGGQPLLAHQRRHGVLGARC